MSPDVFSGLELCQDDAVARAILSDDLVREASIFTPVCGACGRAIDAKRLAIKPLAARCSLCAGFSVLARRR